MFDEERFKNLLSDYFDESLKGGDRVHFEEMLKTATRARELFWEAAEHHAMAREWALASIGADRAAMLDDDGTIAFPVKKSSRMRAIGICLAAAAAAAIVMAFFLFAKTQPVLLPPAAESATPEQPIAMVAMSSAARWDAPGKNYLQNDSLLAGPLKLLSGSVRIDLYSGTCVWLSGPAEIDLISDKEILLKSGALLAEVPSAAKGFRVLSGDLTVTDLGTEFGVSSFNGVQEVHVFDGKAEVKGQQDREARLLADGQALKVERGIWTGTPADYAKFPDRAAIIQGLIYERESRYAEWKKYSAEFSRKDDVIVHYLFSPDENGKIPNLVPKAPEMTYGTLIGGEWSSGRWERKRALSFNGVSDRVRLVVPGQYKAVTFLTWIRLDDLPKQLSAVFRVEDKVPGTLRWGIDQYGRVRLGVFTPDETFASPDLKGPFPWDLAMSKPIMGKELGHWVHLAAVYDSANQVSGLWLNGEQIAKRKLRYNLPATIGVSQIGSALALDGPETSGRTIDGRMDEFAIIGRAFTESEIRSHYRQGKPRDSRNMVDPAGW